MRTASRRTDPVKVKRWPPNGEHDGSRGFIDGYAGDAVLTGTGVGGGDSVGPARRGVIVELLVPDQGNTHDNVW